MEATRPLHGMLKDITEPIWANVQVLGQMVTPGRATLLVDDLGTIAAAMVPKMKIVIVPFLARMELKILRALFALAVLWLIGTWLWRRCRRMAQTAFRWIPAAVLILFAAVKGRELVYRVTSAGSRLWPHMGWISTLVAVIPLLKARAFPLVAALRAGQKESFKDSSESELRNRIIILEKLLVGVGVSSATEDPLNKCDASASPLLGPQGSSGKKRRFEDDSKDDNSKHKASEGSNGEQKQNKTRCLSCGKTVMPDKHDCWVLKREVTCYRCQGKNHIAIMCDDNKKKMTMEVSSGPDQTFLLEELKRLQAQISKLESAPGQVIDAPQVLSFCAGEEPSQQLRREAAQCSCPY